MWTFPYYIPGQLPDWQALERRFSWFADMKDVPQDPEWHAEGDVFTHTKMVCEALLQLPEFQALDEQEQHILFAAAILHDVEKRSTTKREIENGKERIVSPHHAKKGEHTARTLLYTEFAAPFAVREAIAKLVRLHGLPLWAINKPNPDRAIIAASLQVNTAHLAMLAKADVLGRICCDQQDILLRVDLFRELCEENACWGKARTFASDYGRYLYLNGRSEMPDYQPFDDQTFEVYAMCAIAGRQVAAKTATSGNILPIYLCFRSMRFAVSVNSIPQIPNIPPKQCVWVKSRQKNTCEPVRHLSSMRPISTATCAVNGCRCLPITAHVCISFIWKCLTRNYYRKTVTANILFRMMCCTA